MRNRLLTMLAAAAAVCVPALLIAATLTGQLHTEIIVSYTGSNDLGSPRFTLSQGNQAPIALANGTGSGQANLLFADQRTIAASSSENLDLAGVLTDPFGNTLTFAAIKVIRICASSANTNNVLVGGAASNTFLGMFDDATDIIRVKPGGCFLWIAPQTGATVTASTGDILKIANSSSGTGVTYDVTILGI
jgi:hypothetical protein